MTTDYRDLITRMAKELDEYRQLLLDDRTVTHRLSNEARAALADEPAVPAPTVMEIIELSEEVEAAGLGQVDFARAVLARWGKVAPVPVAVSDALIKAECALSDIAEGEPMADEGDPLKWAERRCADTLAIIRPTMMQHKIRTSEWPPVAATAKPLPEVGE